MKLSIAILLVGATLTAAEPKPPCQHNYAKVGCFKDNVVPERALKTQLLNRIDPHSKKGDGKLIDLKNYGASLKDLVCKCSQLAKAGGYDYFGIQFYGECWAGNAKDFGRYGISKGGCVDANLKDDSCGSKSPQCAGKCGENFIYRIRMDLARHLNGKIITLKSAHGKYVVAEGNGQANANRNAAGPWERFLVEYVSENKIGLKSVAHNKYLVAEANGHCNANRGSRGPWEEFNVEKVSDGHLALKSYHGKYVVAEKDGRLNANRNGRGAWEIFHYNIIPVDGGWSAWGKYGACAGRCGNRGVQRRHRQCINPRPADGGKGCAGLSFSTRFCQTATCTGKWQNWSSWSQCVQTRRRGCTVNGKPAHWSKCGNKPTEQRTCKNCQGNWAGWGAWSGCGNPNKPCGTGTKIRRRVCLPFPGFNCPGKSEEQMSCEHQCEKSWTAWEPWGRCSKTCGGGLRIRIRKCVADGTNIIVPGCPGTPVQRGTCNTQNCPVWVWGPWGRCSRTCGPGVQSRAQICVVTGSSKPTSGCAGKPRSETKACLVKGCPVWTPWGSWSLCPKCRFPGQPIPQQTRSRRCVYEGTNTKAVGCSGFSVEKRNCHTLICFPTGPPTRTFCRYPCQKTDFEGPVCARNNAGKQWTVINECAFKQMRKCQMPGITMTHGRCLTHIGPGIPFGPKLPPGPAQ